MADKGDHQKLHYKLKRYIQQDESISWLHSPKKIRRDLLKSFYSTYIIYSFHQRDCNFKV